MPAVQDSIDAIRIAAAAADRMKATDLVAFDVTEPLAITDAMLIATASNERQVLSVAEEIEKDLYLKSGKRQPRSREGLTEGQWVLLDYGDFVIHVMHQESRDFYRLERLWKDCPSIDLQLEHPETSTKRPRKPRNNTYEHAFTFECGRHVFISSETVFANSIIEKATENSSMPRNVELEHNSAVPEHVHAITLVRHGRTAYNAQHRLQGPDRHSPRRSRPVAGSPNSGRIA